MQINIRRGLIRAWIVGSVLWLGFGIVFLRPLTHIETLLSKPGTITVKGVNDCMFLPDKLAKARCMKAQAIENARERLRIERVKTAKAELQFIALITLFPPIGVLAFGFVGGWVLRGFRKDAAPEE